MKKTIAFLLFVCCVSSATSQVTVLRRQRTAPAPVTYSTSSPEPIPATTYSYSDADNRRAAAVSKVQRLRSGATEARGVRPAEYGPGGATAPVLYSTTPEPATTVTVNGLQVQRNVRKGRGQVGNQLFTPVDELHYVQFAVYCKDTPVDKAPPIDGLYLLWHPGSTCPGGEQGASYIVKGYNSPGEAKSAVAAYKAAGIDCWYNPALTGAEVEIIGVR